MKKSELKGIIKGLIRELLKEEVSVIPYDIASDFTKFTSGIDSSIENAKRSFQKTLKSKLVGKKITVRASKGDANQIKTDYVITPTGANIAEINNDWKIYLVGEDKKRYFVDEKFKIKVTTSQEVPQSNPSSMPQEPTTGMAPTQTSEKPVAGNIVPQK